MKRVVITGVGCVTALGDEIQTIWELMEKNVSGIQKINDANVSNEICQFGGINDKINLKKMTIAGKNILNHNNKLMIYSFLKTLEGYKIEGGKFSKEDAIYIGNQLQHMDIETLNIIIESSMSKGNMDFSKLGEVLHKLPPLSGLKLLPTAPSHCIAKHLDVHGEGNLNYSGDTSGLLNLYLAFKDIEGGVIERAIVCAAASPFTPHEFLWVCEEEKVRETNVSDIETNLAYPFDERHRGIIYGEGAGCIILETEESALINNREILCFIEGGACNIFPGEKFDELTSENFEKNMRQSLENSNNRDRDIDLVFTNASSYPKWDNAEICAIHNLWKNSSVSVSNSKAYLGYTAAAASIIDCILAIKSMKDNLYLPVGNFGQLDSSLNISESIYFKSKDTFNKALINSAGLGGSYCSIILGK